MKLLLIEGESERYAIVDAADKVRWTGTSAELKAMHKVVVRFLETTKLGGQIDADDPRLANDWLDAVQAHKRFGVPRSTITWACRHGRIAGARKGRHGWEFRAADFLEWFDNRPGRGRWR